MLLTHTCASEHDQIVLASMSLEGHPVQEFARSFGLISRWEEEMKLRGRKMSVVQLSRCTSSYEQSTEPRYRKGSMRAASKTLRL